MSPIDACRNYITNKNCFYLAKEDLVVYYSSDTGRKQDAQWHKMTLAQTYRIISSMYFKRFDSGSLLQAFQEEDRVYERGVSSRYKVAEGLFNYYENNDQDILDKVLDSLVSNLIKNDYTAVFIRDLNVIFTEIKVELDLYDEGYTAKLHAALEFKGFDVRVQSRRPRVGGVLTSCALFGSSKPKDIESITPENQKRMIKEVVKEFK